MNQIDVVHTWQQCAICQQTRSREFAVLELEDNKVYICCGCYLLPVQINTEVDKEFNHTVIKLSL